MTDQIEEIKQKTDIVALISEYIDLKKAGRNYKALCPFHGEKLPSFMVSPELQIFKCFGCGVSGDVYAFLKEYEGMDFGEALRFLAERAGIELKPFREGEKSEKQKLYEINNYANHFYHYILLNHSVGRVALKYLTQNRGLKVDTIKKFQLGFSPDTPLALRKYLVEKKRIRIDSLVRAGIVYKTERGTFDRFRGRVIFPLFDHRGNVAGFAGRLLPGAKSKLAKYINTPDTPVYHKSNLLYGLNITRPDIKRSKKAVVVEGELDMISSWQIGVKDTVAIKGSALTEQQARILARFSETLVLALDADIAGDAAARRGIKIAEGQGLEVKVAQLKGFKDPDEAVRKAPKSFIKAIEKPVGVWDFIIDSIFVRFNEKTGVGKAKISKEVIPVLASIADTIVRAHYAGVVGKKLGVETETVLDEVVKSEGEKDTVKEKIDEIVKPKVKSRRVLLEEKLLSLCFRSDPKVLTKRKVYGLVQSSLARRILGEYKSFSKTKKDFDPSVFASKLPKELFSGFSDMLLKEEGKVYRGKRISKSKELAMVLKELEILVIKEKLDKLSEKIKKVEGQKKGKGLKRIEQEFKNKAQKLAELETED